jgi:hypothetical protein
VSGEELWGFRDRGHASIDRLGMLKGSAAGLDSDAVTCAAAATAIRLDRPSDRVARASEQPTAKNEPQVVPFVRISIFSSQTSRAFCAQVALHASALIRALAAILRARGVNMWCAKMYPPHKTSSKMFRHAGTGF